MLVLFTRYQVQFKNTCAILGLAENKTRIKREKNRDNCYLKSKYFSLTSPHTPPHKKEKEKKGISLSSSTKTTPSELKT